MKQAFAAIWLAGLSVSAGAALGSEQEGIPGVQSPSEEIVLEGVIVSRDPSLSIALLRRAGASRARPIRVGETFHGLKLVSVSDSAALLEGEGQRVALEIGRPAAPGRAEQGASPGPARSARDAAASSSFGLAGGGWVRRELARSVAEERLAKEMPVILAETALAPWFEEGEVKGLRITRLPEETVLAETGLRLGDVLLSINEIPLNSLTALAGLYPRLQSESEIRVVLEREGRVLKLAYELQ